MDGLNLQLIHRMFLLSVLESTHRLLWTVVGCMIPMRLQSVCATVGFSQRSSCCVLGYLQYSSYKCLSVKRVFA